MNKASDAARELAKRSVAARRNWGAVGFRERMRAWGRLGGRPPKKERAMGTESVTVTGTVVEAKKRRAWAGKPDRGISEKVLGSGVWWICFVDAQGRYRREKAGTWGNADKLLTKRRNEALQGKKLPETLRRRVVLFGEIGDDALGYSRIHKRSYKDDGSRMKRLVEWFGNREAEITHWPGNGKPPFGCGSDREVGREYFQSLPKPADVDLPRGSARR